MNRILFFLLIALHLQAQSSREKKGFVEVESENYIYQTKADIRKWKIIDKNNPDDAVHSAGKNKYIKCLPDTRVTHDDTLINGVNFSNQPGLLAVVHYKINFTTPGRYYVWVRAYSTGSEDNGIHVGIENKWPESGQRMQWCEGKNKWTWASKQRTQQNHCGEPYKIYLDIDKPGKQLVQFSMREDGFRFDKFILTKDRDFDPNHMPRLNQ